MIDIGPGYDRLGEAMLDEGIYEIRRFQSTGTFTVKLTDGRTGQGKTIRQAIETANLERLGGRYD